MKDLGLNVFGRPLEEAWMPMRYHKLQSEAYYSKRRFVGLACGRGSGKTELARRRIVRFLPVKRPWSDPLYFYALPTYNQAKRVAWKPLLNLIPRSWIKGDPSLASMVIETVFGSTLYVVGMDKPQRIEGVQWDGGVVDESCDQKPGTFDRSIMPGLTHRAAWCWRIGVPKRYGVGAAEFKEFCELGESGEDPDTIAYSWPSSDILTEEQLAAAQRILDPRDYNEQFGASWQDIGGAIYYAYSERNLDSSLAYNPELPLIIGSDFNVDPMCWIIGHISEAKLLVFDELMIRNTNTQATLDELYRRYGQHKAGWLFLGDATARARKTSATASDYIQIRNDERFVNKRVKYLSSNPLQTDRFASCNALLQNAKGEIRCLIHPKCVRLIRDLKGRTYKEGTREPEDSDTDMGHMSDAFGYVVHAVFPIKIETLSESLPKVVVMR